MNKTAIQLMIEDLKKYGFDVEKLSIMSKYLELEKEQMLDFGLHVKKNGWVGCKIEDLYEDYNNQNK